MTTTIRTLDLDLLKFNGILTITHRATGQNRTFRIRRARRGRIKGWQIIYLQTKPTLSRRIWKDFGYVTDNGVVRTWTVEGDEGHQKFTHLLNHLRTYYDNNLIEIKLITRCQHCHRKLTDRGTMYCGLESDCRRMRR